VGRGKGGVPGEKQTRKSKIREKMRTFRGRRLNDATNRRSFRRLEESKGMMPHRLEGGNPTKIRQTGKNEGGGQTGRPKRVFFGSAKLHNGILGLKKENIEIPLFQKAKRESKGGRTNAKPLKKRERLSKHET